MTCRWTLNLRGLADAWLDAPGALALYLELARQGREDDFRWFARSQGVPEDRLEPLWSGLRARLGLAPRHPA